MIALVAVTAVCTVVASGRWLRVAQREHYLPGVVRFARLWWTVDARNRLLLAVVLACAALSSLVQPLAMVALVVSAIGPLGLGVRGRTSQLVWTARLRRLTLVVGVLASALVIIGAVIDSALLLSLVAFGVPLLIDAALGLTDGYERRQGDRWVEQAAADLARVDPLVIAITGSYGKTSTKNIVAHLLGGMRSVVASPASFNNRMGLARAVNEHLSPGSDTFVAEMGTYGPGEIRELCRWVRPKVAVITALGPVHLERMGSLETIAAAKREILEEAPVAVVSIDHPLLAEIASEESNHRRVITVSAGNEPADVVVSSGGEVLVQGEMVGSFQLDRAHPTNVACAMGVVVALGIEPHQVADLLAGLPETPHRRSVGRSERGVVIIDDTFNANPAGAEAALRLLTDLGTDEGRKVVVTPGMVELGTQQGAANRTFARAAGQAGVTDFVVVNRTNRSDLISGAREGGVGSVIVFDTRDDAVQWVRDTLVEGDAVLYENDLPDHYP